jgi:polar amino acid transport system substrate-binding protein
MKIVMQSYRTGELKLQEAPPPQLRDGHVLVKTAYSLISAGTEKTKIDTAEKSLLGKAKARPDLVQQVIRRAKREGLWKTWQLVSERLNTPLAMGYSSAGIVIDTMGDVGDVRPGDRVACGGSHANHAEVVCVPKNLIVPVPEGVGTDHAAFATLGAIAMQGVRQAEARLGEKVLVIGLGLVGLLTLQILKAAGCKVFGIDLDPSKLGLAGSLGCDTTALVDDSELEEKILLFTNGYGVDSTIITAGTSSNQPIEQAAELTREKGRVVVVGVTKMDIPREPFYMKELELRMSRSYGPGRYDSTFEEAGNDYPYAYVRFTETRNMSSFLDLVAAGIVRLDPIITHRFSIQDAATAYDIMRGSRKENYLGILLEYNRDISTASTRIEMRPEPITSAAINLGVIGAGKYATANLLPHLKNQPEIALGAICTASGLTAVNVAERFGFRAADADADAVIRGSDAILIATRHNDHASYAVKALLQGRAVFVEKPLVVNWEQLDQITSAAASGGSVMVGFNRRFSPMVESIRDHISSTVGPKQILIRVNAGPIPMDHWMQDARIGGGRLIGEACHFVDLALYLSGAPIRTVPRCGYSSGRTVTRAARQFLHPFGIRQRIGSDDRVYKRGRSGFTQGICGGIRGRKGRHHTRLQVGRALEAGKEPASTLVATR